MDRGRLGVFVKTRYQNNLPPPPFPPKLVDYDVSTQDLLSAGSLSAIFLRNPLSTEVDIESGMPVDFAYNYLDQQTTAAASADKQLSAKDLALLEEAVPSGYGSNSDISSFSSVATQKPSTSSSMSYREASGANDIGIGTSFLRRTAYMSTDTRRSMKRAAPVSNEKKDFNSELKKIEDGFKACKTPLGELRHPTNSKLKAVKATPLLPDLKDSDLQFVDVRFVGSASLQNLQQPPDSAQLLASVLRHTHLNDVDEMLDEEWMTLFVPTSDETAAKLTKYRSDTRDTLPTEEALVEEETVYELKKVQDNNMQILVPKDEIDEILLTEAVDGSAYYYTPISARINLSRRRVDLQTQKQIQQSDFDYLDLKLRELTPDESMQRDEVRSIYDPVNFG